MAEIVPHRLRPVTLYWARHAACQGRSGRCRRNPWTRSLVVDDHQMVRVGLVSPLDGAEGLHVIGQAVDGTEAIDVVTDNPLDVVGNERETFLVCQTNPTYCPPHGPDWR